MDTFASTSISDVQEYWDQRPCNVRHSPLPVGSREYFDQVESRKYLVEPHIPQFAEFSRWSGRRVLEIGCGIGTDTVNFARAGARVVAVDLSSQSLEIARRRAEVFGVQDRVEFVHCDAETLAGVSPELSFDFIYSFGVIHHTPHPGRVLEQAKRRLAPGGLVRVMVYHRRSWKVAEIALRGACGGHFDVERLVAEYSEAQTGCPVTYTYTRRSARALFEGAGLRVTKFDVDHIFQYRVPEYVRYQYVRRAPFALLPSAANRWLERTFGWHLMVTATCR